MQPPEVLECGGHGVPCSPRPCSMGRLWHGHRATYSQIQPTAPASLRPLLQVLLGLVLLPPLVAGFTAILQRSSPYVGLYLWAFLLAVSLFMVSGGGEGGWERDGWVAERQPVSEAGCRLPGSRAGWHGLCPPTPPHTN